MKAGFTGANENVGALEAVARAAGAALGAPQVAMGARVEAKLL